MRTKEAVKLLKELRKTPLGLFGHTTPMGVGHRTDIKTHHISARDKTEFYPKSNLWGLGEKY